MSSTLGWRRSKRKGAENTAQRDIKRLKTHLHVTPQEPGGSTTPSPNARSTPPDEKIPASGPSTVTNPAKVRGGASSPKSKATAATGLESVLQGLHISANVMPSLKPAISGLVSCLDAVQAATTNAEDYDELTSELNIIAHTLKEHLKELSSEDSDNNPTYPQLALSIETEVAHIKNRQNRGKSKISLQTLKSVNKQHVTTLLQGMSPVDEARYNSSYSMTIERRGCTKQTRTHIQTTLQDWAQNPDGARVYWMNGMAGTGKTTIAYSLCEWLEANGKLGASFFCSRASSQCQRVMSIMPTIAYELARYSTAFRVALAKVLESDPGAAKLAVTQQFEKLIQGPVLGIKSCVPAGTVVVIDALDECESGTGVRSILRALLEPGANFPLKFFVTSRPEPIIYKEMTSLTGYSPVVLHLHDIEQSIVEEDIEKYITEALDPMSPSPSDNQIRQLAQQSGKLFIYAATVVRYILPEKAGANSMSRLAAILSTDSQQTSNGTSKKRYKRLDELYTAILTAAFDEELEEEETEPMRLAMWTVLCAQEPMHISTIASFLSLTKEQVASALEPLRSVLHVPESTELVSILHASFSDYMLEPSRSGHFCCNQTWHNRKLASRCFDIMKEQLRFNICHLSSSSVRDKDVKDLDQRIGHYISPELSYTCWYWGNHLHAGGAPDSLRCEVIDFLKFRLLFWMEVINLTQRSFHGVFALAPLAGTGIAPELVADAHEFVSRFSFEDYSSSTPHIYISALPFLVKKNSSVYAHYWGRMRGLIDVHRTAADYRSECTPETWIQENPVTSFKFSTDGACIVHGDTHGSIYLRDARTGNIINGPFRGDTGKIYTVSFSSNDSHIVSTAENRIVRVRDAHTGEVIAESLTEKHQDLTGPIVISPDATCVATGWKDFSIRLWDACTGSAISKPLEGHTGRISSIAFSHNSGHIVSGSADTTIRVWDGSTGEIAAGPFKGHVYPVSSISISPDGTRIASRSDEGNIRLWHTNTGKAVVISPTRNVQAVAFSYSSAFIVTGSYDTVTVWDARTGGMVARLLGVPTPHVVAFSPDDTRILYSTYRDIQVWNWHLDAENVRSRRNDWFTDHNGLLFRAPRKYLSHIPHPRGTILMDRYNGILIEYQNLLMGERWAECFVS